MNYRSHFPFTQTCLGLSAFLALFFAAQSSAARGFLRSFERFFVPSFNIICLLGCQVVFIGSISPVLGCACSSGTMMQSSGFGLGSGMISSCQLNGLVRLMTSNKRTLNIPSLSRLSASKFVNSFRYLNCHLYGFVFRHPVIVT